MYIRSEYESKKKLKYLQSYKPPQENNVTSKFVFDLGDLKMASATSVNYLYHDGLHATSPSLKLSPWFTMYIAFRDGTMRGTIMHVPVGARTSPMRSLPTRRQNRVVHTSS